MKFLICIMIINDIIIRKIILFIEEITFSFFRI